VDSQIALAFVKRYRTSLDARRLGEQRLDAFLERHDYPGRRPGRELLAKLRAGAEGRAGELEMAARRQVVLAMPSALEPIVEGGEWSSSDLTRKPPESLTLRRGG
jgi:hypothetical protein